MDDVETTECIECGCHSFYGLFNGYQFIWYCSDCDREFDGHSDKDISEMSDGDKDYYLHLDDY